MPLIKMTVTQSALFFVVCIGLFAAVFFIWAVHRHHGHRRSYLPFIDLVSYVLTGLSIVVGISVGLWAFSDQYPNQLKEAGLTNESESYRRVYDEIRARHDQVCSSTTTNELDCGEMRRFLLDAYEELEGDSLLVPFSGELAPSTPQDTRALIAEYNRQHAITPRPMAIAVAILNHVSWLALPLWIGFALGLHRRWILFRQSFRLA